MFARIERLCRPDRGKRRDLREAPFAGRRQQVAQECVFPKVVSRAWLHPNKSLLKSASCFLRRPLPPAPLGKTCPRIPVQIQRPRSTWLLPRLFRLSGHAMGHKTHALPSVCSLRYPNKPRTDPGLFHGLQFLMKFEATDPLNRGEKQIHKPFPSILRHVSSTWSRATCPSFLMSSSFCLRLVPRAFDMILVIHCGSGQNESWGNS